MWRMWALQVVVNMCTKRPKAMRGLEAGLLSEPLQKHGPPTAGHWRSVMVRPRQPMEGSFPSPSSFWMYACAASAAAQVHTPSKEAGRPAQFASPHRVVDLRCLKATFRRPPQNAMRLSDRQRAEMLEQRALLLERMAHLMAQRRNVIAALTASMPTARDDRCNAVGFVKVTPVSSTFLEHMLGTAALPNHVSRGLLWARQLHTTGHSTNVGGWGIFVPSCRSAVAPHYCAATVRRQAR